ncbi:hypothetical protein U9M48_038591 [Paspalum notatum var. saurae]|uniref:DUF8040 domain-containing protein n=1 Tax=Paspalum notatum var. saurae TaxID=547442 RepID=A0AAQ3UH60_PASNO
MRPPPPPVSHFSAVLPLPLSPLPPYSPRLPHGTYSTDLKDDSELRLLFLCFTCSYLSKTTSSGSPPKSTLYRSEPLAPPILEEEYDDELFFVILPTIIPYLPEEKRSIHISSLTGAKKEEMLWHESWCKSEFRMEPKIFKATSSFLRVENLLRDTRGVTVEEQLEMFMFMISHNASNQMLQKFFQYSGETIHRKISEVFYIVPTLTQRFVKLPTSVQTQTRIG